MRPNNGKAFGDPYFLAGTSFLLQERYSSPCQPSLSSKRGNRMKLEFFKHEQLNYSHRARPVCIESTSAE